VEGSTFIPSGQSYWIGSANDTGNRLRLHHNGNAYIDYSPKLHIRSGTTSVMAIDSIGNVGIGTTFPTAKLDVNGTIKATALSLTGSHTTGGNYLDILNANPNEMKAVLARLEGRGFYLGVMAYNTEPVNCKSFSIEHKYYDYINSAINFYRGGDHQGGYMTFDVHDGRTVGKLSHVGLDIYGTIQTKEVIVSNISWADFVFSEGYQLPTLNEVKLHIDKNKHLPGIPTEKEVKENGVNIGEMQSKLLQKIEELTLYLIQQDNTIRELKAEIQELKENN
jgi:hypothetical protein